MASVEEIEHAVILFAGDSGDGIQLVGGHMADVSAIFGNDVATLPSFPAEIRAPQGTEAGVSAFQMQIADSDILTPGDEADVFVAFNPAALKKFLPMLKLGGILIVNAEQFEEKDLQKAGYDSNPLEDNSLGAYEVIRVDMNKLTAEAIAPSGISGRAAKRPRNFFAIGVVAWLFDRPKDTALAWISKKYIGKDQVGEANTLAFEGGWKHAAAIELFQQSFSVKPAALAPGRYTIVDGNAALAWGLIAAAQLAELPLYYGSYPITPASSVLEELARAKHFGVKTFQAEDEIAAVGSAIGAAFGGVLAATGTSGPGLALKGEGIALACAIELPLIIVNVQRAGPSTGMPTKPEQADLYIALHGRHGEAPIPVLAIASQADAFETTIEAVRIAIEHMTPVILLSDGYIATTAAPWMLPDIAALERIIVPSVTKSEDGLFLPYRRDDETLVRPWAAPGHAGLEHRVGGLEKEHLTGNVSYDPENHEKMTGLREEKVARIADRLPPIEVLGDESADILVLGWGSTHAAISAAVGRVRSAGTAVAQAHIRWLNPFPKNLGDVLASYETILIPELNRGQLAHEIRAVYGVDVISLSKVQGSPFLIREIEAAILEEVAS